MLEIVHGRSRFAKRQKDIELADPLSRSNVSMATIANDSEYRATHHWDSRSWRLVLQDSVQSSIGLTRRPRLLSETSKFRSIITSWRLDGQSRKLLKRRASDSRRQTVNLVLVTKNTNQGLTYPSIVLCLEGRWLGGQSRSSRRFLGKGQWHVSAREPRSLRLPNHSNAALEGGRSKH